MNLAYQTFDVRTGCVRDVRVYLVYLFIVCYWYIRFAVIETGLVCAFYFYSSSRYCGPTEIFFFLFESYHAQIACWSTLQTHVFIHIHSINRVVFFVVVAVLDSRFDIFSSLSLAHSFMLIEFVDSMISSRDTYHIIIMIPIQRCDRITFRFRFRLTKSPVHRPDPIHSKKFRKEKKNRFRLLSIEMFWCWRVWALSHFLCYRISPFRINFNQLNYSMKLLDAMTFIT